MIRTRVKVCGITNVEDALLCAHLGADALGFIFVPVSPRAIVQERAAGIIARLPVFVARVGVFMDADMEFVAETALYCSLTAIQLHGCEPAEYTQELKRRTKLNIIKTFRPVPGDNAVDMNSYPADAFLLDSARKGNRAGGTGIEIDPDAAHAAVAAAHRPVVLAGGMNADNVEDYIRRCRPYGVDVCSGTEETPGRKSGVKVEEFFRAVSRADAD